jgi:anthranilate synthase/aminodeoxychorismate synthase-like glutamine amidotransferase
VKRPRILVIDNYDSFTFNLVQYLGELGAQPQVVRNDEITANQLSRPRFDGLVISPGPGTPDDAGVSVDAIRAVEGRRPILGVCLGHQCLAVAHGGRVGASARILHGKTSSILHTGRGLFEGLENPFTATRYHSLEVPRQGLPASLEAQAWTTDDELMAIKSRGTESWGVQFHPESILTTAGKQLVENFVNLSRRRGSR